MRLKYNAKRHKQLFEYSKSLKRRSKIMRKELADELYGYKAQLSSQLHWEMRDELLELVQNYLQLVQNCPEKKDELSGSYYFYREISDNLAWNREVADRFLCDPIDNIDKRAMEFADLISDITMSYQSYEGGEEEDRSPYFISLDTFNEEVQEAFLKLKKLIAEEESESDDNSDL